MARRGYSPLRPIYLDEVSSSMSRIHTTRYHIGWLDGMEGAWRELTGGRVTHLCEGS